jgi:hypothetical protein
MVIFWSLMIGPHMLRQDFRNDLAVADVLKSFPMRGWQVVLGELLAPAAILTGLQWLLIVLAAGFFTRISQGENVPLRWRVLVGLGAAMIFPVVNLILLVIPNASVLVFPGWFQTGRDGPQGIEATGQRLIFFFGQVVVFLAALIPAGLAFAAVCYPLWHFGQHVVAIPAASLVAALVLGMEAALAVFLLGRIFERFDLSAEA